MKSFVRPKWHFCQIIKNFGSYQRAFCEPIGIMGGEMLRFNDDFKDCIFPVPDEK